MHVPTSTRIFEVDILFTLLSIQLIYFLSNSLAVVFDTLVF